MPKSPAQPNWTLDSIPWREFRADLVEPRLLAFAKGASMVESNAADYVEYLLGVFVDAPEMHDEIIAWGAEERQHGLALRRWAELADPTFDYDASFRLFRENYRLPVDVSESVRGSRAAELVARCVVESGTSGFYTALRDGGREPVLREICRRIAGDEIRHYTLFLHHLNRRFAAEDRLNVWRRLRTIAGRMVEASDEELCFAFFAANEPHRFDATRVREYSRRYMAFAASIYEPKHFTHTAALLGRAAGLDLKPWAKKILGRVMHAALVWKFGDRAVLSGAFQ